MLRSISIRNLAVVAAADVELGPGLTVLSGETGVGKSIVLDAVELVLGGRASADLVRTGEAAASLSATFEHQGRSLTLSRELSATGRSRGSIDGVAATGTSLRDLAPNLVEIHGQHAHLALLDPASHLGLLDAYVRPGEALAAVSYTWQVLRQAQSRLERARMNTVDRQRRLDRIAEELQEIDAARPRSGEIEELNAQRGVLMHADRIQRLCQDSYDALYGQDDAAMSVLAGVWKRVAELAELDPAFQTHTEARAAIKGQLEDLAESLRHTAEQMDGAAAKLDAVESRLTALQRLARKFGPTIDDILTLADAHRTEQALLTGPEGEESALQAAHDAARREYLDVAQRLSAQRRREAPRFAREFERLLQQLAMEHARVEVRFDDRAQRDDEWTERGLDGVELYLSANLGESPRPLAKVISGGELSRAVLALRTISASVHEGRTLIFDEVDAGLGGRTADVVGQCLRSLSSRFQVIAITHVPQIAAYADQQIRVRKETANGRTVTRIDHLTPDGRRDEIARMLAGSHITPAALDAADQLLAAARAGLVPASESKHRAKAKP